MEEPELLTVEEAARLLSIGRSRAYQMVAAGEMPGVIRLPMAGKSIRIVRRKLVEWVDAQVGDV